MDISGECTSKQIKRGKGRVCIIVYHNNVSTQEERMNKKRERVRGNDCHRTLG